MCVKPFRDLNCVNLRGNGRKALTRHACAGGVAFAPVGQYFVTASHDQTARWVPTPQTKSRISAPLHHHFQIVLVCPDLLYALCLRLWDIEHSQSGPLRCDRNFPPNHHPHVPAETSVPRTHYIHAFASFVSYGAFSTAPVLTILPTVYSLGT
jgi:hypothetical protein